MTTKGVGAHISGAILFKKAGKKIPDACLETILQHNPSFYGLLFRDEGKLKIESGDEPTLEDLNGLLDIVADQDVLIHVGYDPNGGTADVNIQPFSALVEKDGALFVSLLAGDFSKFQEADAPKISAEASFNKNVLQLWLNDFYVQAKQDIDGVHELLKQNYVKTLMHCTIPEGGTIVIMNKNGKVNKFVTGDEYTKFDWGWTSNSYGYVESDEAAPAEETPTTPVQAPIAPEKIKEAVETPVTDDDDADDSVDLLNGGTKEFKDGKWWVKPPKAAGTWANGNKRSWYNTVVGFVPKSDVWKSCKAVPVPLEMQVKFGPPPGTMAIPPKTETASIRTVVDNTKPATSTAPVKSPAGAPDGVALKSLIVDKGSQRMPSPEYLEELHKKVPTFCEMVGIEGLEDTFQLSYDALVRLGKLNVEALARLAFDRGVAYYNSLAEEHVVEGDTDVPVKPPVTPPAPVVTEVKKKKRSAFG